MAECLAIQENRQLLQDSEDVPANLQNDLSLPTTVIDVPGTNKSSPYDPSDEYSVDEDCPHISKEQEPENMSAGAQKLRSWLNKTFRIEMSDGRVLLGVFLCTDRDRNIILGSCSEYLPPKTAIDGEDSHDPPEEPRVLGLVMVPGKHILSIHLDELGVNSPQESDENEDGMW